MDNNYSDVSAINESELAEISSKEEFSGVCSIPKCLIRFILNIH